MNGDPHRSITIYPILRKVTNSALKFGNFRCASWVLSEIRFLKEFDCYAQRYFCMVYDYVEKADVSKGYQNPKRKLGETTHSSEIIGRKCHHSFYFKPF